MSANLKEKSEMVLAQLGMRRGNNDKIIEVVLDIANLGLAKIPMKYICHCIKDFGGRSEAEW